MDSDEHVALWIRAGMERWDVEPDELAWACAEAMARRSDRMGSDKLADMWRSCAMTEPAIVFEALIDGLPSAGARGALFAGFWLGAEVGILLADKVRVSE